MSWGEREAAPPYTPAAPVRREPPRREPPVPPYTKVDALVASHALPAAAAAAPASGSSENSSPGASSWSSGMAQRTSLSNTHSSNPWPPAATPVGGTSTPPGDTSFVDRVMVQATLDNEHFSVVNVTGLASAPEIRAAIMLKLHIPLNEAARWSIYRTEIGGPDVVMSPSIDDDTLLALCLQLGDDKGSVKFRLERTGPRPDDSAATEPPRMASVPPYSYQAVGGAAVRSTPELSQGLAMSAAPAGRTPRAPVGTAPLRGRSRENAHRPSHSMSAATSPALTRHQPRAPLFASPQMGAHRVQDDLWWTTPEAKRLSFQDGPRASPLDAAPSRVSAYLAGPPPDPPSPSTHASTDTTPRSPLPRPPSSTPSTASMPEDMLSRPPASPATNSTSSARTGTGWTPLAPTRASPSAPMRVYPMMKSASEAVIPSRPLPIIPQRSTSSHSTASTSSNGGSVPSESRSHTEVSRNPFHQVHFQRMVQETPSQSPLPQCMSKWQLAQSQPSNDQASALFGTFSDDSLGGTFAQPLDASTWRSSRASPGTTLMTSPASTPDGRQDGARPVLTLAIGPRSQSAGQSDSHRPPGNDAPTPAAPDAMPFDGRGLRGHASSDAATLPTHVDDNTWALRPTAEQLYEQLDAWFPNTKLDQPLHEVGAEPSSLDPADVEEEPASASELPRPGKTIMGPLPSRPSIRVIAKHRQRILASEEARRVPSQNERANSALARRSSTKLWGGCMVEMQPDGGSSVGVVPMSGPETQDEQRRTYLSLTSAVFKWIKGDLIGRGTFGRVYLALNATTGEMLAVKQVELPRTAADRASSRQRQLVTALKSEIKTLQELDHPNVVTCLGFEETADTLSIFLEYVPGGSIGSCLRRYGRLDENTTSSFINQTLQGLAYLHSRGILHRDLKADNLLVDYHGICKISDFGTVRHSHDIYANVQDMSLQGSLFWMAPEVVRLSSQGYSAKVDIWSLGCVVLEMLAGRRPWSDEEAVQAMFKIGAEQLAPPVPDDVKLTKPAAHFLRKCFEVDPERRPTAVRLLEHVFAWPAPGWRFEDSALAKALAPP